MLLIAILMMSTVRFPSGKKLDLQTQTRLRWLLGFVIMVGVIHLPRGCPDLYLLGLHWVRIDSSTGAAGRRRPGSAERPKSL